MITRKSYCLFLILIGFYAGNVKAQTLDLNKATVDDVEWSEGTVTLPNGAILSGLLRLNTRTGVLGYESGSISKSFNPRSVLGFSYFDAQQQKERRFLSIAYSDGKPKDDGVLAATKKDRQKTKEEIAIPKFYEILVECKTFALVSTVGKLNIKQTTGPDNKVDAIINPYSNSSTTYSSNEELLILSEDGTFETVLEITNKEVDRLFFDDKKTKGKAEETVIGKYTAPHYGTIVKFARERELKFKNREDLIQIFEYYKSLTTD